jgi:hypothetical protein
VTVSYDGRLFIIEAPEGVQIQVQPPHDQDCEADAGQANRIRCDIVSSAVRTNLVVFTTSGSSGATEMVDLVAGCNNVALTYPNGTPPGQVAVSPSSALDAIWRYDAATGRFVGYSPLPGAPNDLTALNRLDAVFVCVDTPATLTHPASS